MPFDPTKPINGALADADELRNQLNALKDSIDALATQIGDLQTTVSQQADQIVSLNNMIGDYALITNSSSNTDNIATYDASLNDPPTNDDTTGLRDKLNELIGGLRR